MKAWKILGAAVLGTAVVSVARGRRHRDVKRFSRKFGCAPWRLGMEEAGDGVTTYVVDEIEGVKCKTGVTATPRFKQRMAEHKNGSVKSVRSFRGMTHKRLALCPDYRSASGLAHELESGWSCEKTPGL